MASMCDVRPILVWSGGDPGCVLAGIQQRPQLPLELQQSLPEFFKIRFT